MDILKEIDAVLVNIGDPKYNIVLSHPGNYPKI
jgi:hypothetical protein